MSLELNKAFAAVLTAGVVFMGAGVIGRLVVHEPRLEQAAISIGATPQAIAPVAVAAAPTLEPIGPLLAAANVDTGRGIAGRNCGACHSFTDGGRAGVGPNLWGIVGKNHAQAVGFNYSAANRALADKPWDFEALNAFIAAPNRAMPGTRMAYAGMANTPQRADLIAYLRSLSATPVPLP